MRAPKEEALELVEMFSPHAHTVFTNEAGKVETKKLESLNATACAIIHVEGILAEINVWENDGWAWNITRGNYWNEVLTELKSKA